LTTILNYGIVTLASTTQPSNFVFRCRDVRKSQIHLGPARGRTLPYALHQFERPERPNSVRSATEGVEWACVGERRSCSAEPARETRIRPNGRAMIRGGRGRAFRGLSKPRVKSVLKRGQGVS